MDTSLIPVLKTLEELFVILNNEFFSGELETPVITASTAGRKSAYGWCTTYRAWTDKEKREPIDIVPTPEEMDILTEQDGYYEINICAEYLQRSFNEICETMLHEMCHLYNLQIGVQDCSRGGSYHNTKFKEVAEKHGLEVEKTRYGWSETSLNYQALSFIQSLDKTKFVLHRRFPKKETETKKKSSMRKYMCPECYEQIRATKEVSVVCGKCNKLFLLVVKNEDTGEESLVQPPENAAEKIDAAS